MSPIKKPKSIQQDYGRQPQMKGGKDTPDNKGWLRGGGRSGTYREMIGRETEFVAGQRTQPKHSEFKRPYFDDEFPEMEHFYAPPITDVDGGQSVTFPEGSSVGIFGQVCHKNISGFYQDEECFGYIWMHQELEFETVNISVKQMANGAISGLVRKIFKSNSPLTKDFKVRWSVFQPGFEPVPGEDCKKDHTATKTCGCSAAITQMTYDWITSDDTIERPPGVSTATVAVQDGVGPYEWSVEGVGYTLTDSETVGVSNTLNADGTSCGSATITIKDLTCRNTVVGSVRNITSGQWVAIERVVPDGDEACGMEAPPDTKSCIVIAGTPTYTIQKVEGKFRVTEEWITNFYPSGCGHEDCQQNVMSGFDFSFCLTKSCGLISSFFTTCASGLQTSKCCNDSGSGCGVIGEGRQVFPKATDSPFRIKEEWQCP